MAFSLDEYKDAMKLVESPTGVDAVRAIRDRFLDARESVQQAEQAIHAAAGSRGANLEPLYLRLQQARDTAREAQREFERIGQYGTSLEAQAFANQQRKAQEAEAKKQEEAQLAANALEKAAYKEELRVSYIAGGYSPAEFERRFSEPGGLWDMRVAEKVQRREHELGTNWKA